jgi:hypothetical protein
MSDVEEKEKVASSASGGPDKTVKPLIEVDVIATRDWDEGVDFSLRWEYPAGVWNSGPMVFAKGDTDRKIEYNLVDQTGLDLVFESSADECIWVTDGPCPTTKPAHGSDKGQIKDKDRASNKKLKVKNVNDEVCDLHYALRFTGKEWRRPDGSKSFGPNYSYDPDYRNTGGGGSNT